MALTLEQLRTYEAFDGNIDGWARSRYASDPSSGENWQVIDELLMKLTIKANGGASEGFVSNLEKDIARAAPDAAARQALLALADKLKGQTVMRYLPIWNLIGERYLDTQHDRDYIAQLEAELGRRGVVGARRMLREYVAASALWWNFLWWDWVGLDRRDIVVGWISNLVLFALAATLAAFLGGTLAALAAVLIVHGVTLWIGLELRRGSKEEPGR